MELNSFIRLSVIVYVTVAVTDFLVLCYGVIVPPRTGGSVG